MGKTRRHSVIRNPSFHPKWAAFRSTFPGKNTTAYSKIIKYASFAVCMSVAIDLSVVGLLFCFVFVFYLALINRHAECEYMKNKDIWTLHLVSTSDIAGSTAQTFHE